MSANAICWRKRPREAHVGVSLEPPPSGCMMSATQAHRHRHSSTSRASAGVTVPVLEAVALRFKMERKWVALSASSKRSCTCSTMSTSAGMAALFARFLAGWEDSPDLAAATVSKASKASTALLEVIACPSWASIVSGRLGGGGGDGTLAASSLSASFASAGAFSNPSVARHGARRCSRCKATRTTRPRMRGQSFAAGPISVGSEVAFRRLARPTAQDSENAEEVPSTICLSVSACAGRMALRTS
mmetsp:Transcript_27609/g.79298  ORF Transcript_27609/g.79298 Transcript_27609/m.79298 type:complete len:245 (+) Transcript_27609:833-1567(+)